MLRPQAAGGSNAGSHPLRWLSALLAEAIGDAAALHISQPSLLLAYGTEFLCQPETGTWWLAHHAILLLAAGDDPERAIGQRSLQC